MIVFKEVVVFSKDEADKLVVLFVVKVQYKQDCRLQILLKGVICWTNGEAGEAYVVVILLVVSQMVSQLGRFGDCRKVIILVKVYSLLNPVSEAALKC
jgi:hypothetical protein